MTMFEVNVKTPPPEAALGSEQVEAICTEDAGAVEEAEREAANEARPA